MTRTRGRGLYGNGRGGEHLTNFAVASFVDGDVLVAGGVVVVVVVVVDVVVVVVVVVFAVVVADVDAVVVLC